MIVAVALISFLAVCVFTYCRIVYYGLSSLNGPPASRFAAISRLVLWPVHWLFLWNPAPPNSQDRITGLLLSGHRRPARAKLLLSRADTTMLRFAVAHMPANNHLVTESHAGHDIRGRERCTRRVKPRRVTPEPVIPDELVEHVYRLLKDSGTDWEVISKLITGLVCSPNLLLRITIEELLTPSPEAVADALAFALSQSPALNLDVMKDLSAGMGLLVASFTASNTENPDPVGELWPEEDRSDLGHVLYFMRQLSAQDATFGDLLGVLTHCLPTDQPRWTVFALPCLRTLSLEQPSRFPIDGPEQVWVATEKLRLNSRYVTEAAALKVAGAPGDLDQLVELIQALDS